MIEIICSQCAARLKIKDEWAGKKGKCPNCGLVLAIPQPTATPPAAPPASPLPPLPSLPLDVETVVPGASEQTHPEGIVPARGAVVPPRDAVSPYPAAANAPSPPPEAAAPPPMPEKFALPPARKQSGLAPLRNLPFPLVLALGGGVLLLFVGVLFLVIGGRKGDSAARRPVVDRGRETAVDTENDPDVDTEVESPAAPMDVAERSSPEVAAAPRASQPSPATERVDRHPPPVAGSTAKTTASANPPPATPGLSRGLSGMSRLYHDPHCCEIQNKHGVRVPPAARIIEVDGIRLPIESPGALAASSAPVLLLPRGEHVVRFQTSDRPIAVTIPSDFLDDYLAMRSFFSIEGDIRADELMRRAGQAMDVHGAPYLLNFAGARHAKADRWAAAERHFRRALAVNPTFAPAHLNLAECLARRGAKDEAVRETMAADMFNVGNVCGLTEPIVQMRRKLGIADNQSGSIDAAAFAYVSTEEVNEEDRRLTALMEGISKYAVSADERSKILNNLAVHFADSKRPELALYHFRNALAVVKNSGTGRFAIGRTILANMSQACRKAGFEEAEDYQQMQYLVQP